MKTITTSIAALLLLTGCDNAQTSAPQRPLPEVGIVTLMSQPVSVVSELTGRTAAAMSAEVRPQVGGIIQKRLFTEGDTVKAGQALYQIDPSSYRAAYNEAAAALKQAQALVQADCQKARRYAQLVKTTAYHVRMRKTRSPPVRRTRPASSQRKPRWKAPALTSTGPPSPRRLPDVSASPL